MAGEIVQFPSNGREAEGYLAMPASGSGPGVVVIQEWWGLVPHIKDICDRLAGEGFVALAPDLYHGETTAEPDEAGKLMMDMKIDEAAKDMSGAVDYLAGHDAATGGKVGCVGYCVGGGLSLYLASLKPEIGACVVYYGVLPGAQPDFANIQAPVLGHYAENDNTASPAAARELEGNLRSLGKEVEFHIYPGTEHAFFNDTRADVYDADAAKLSWERTLPFFRAHLG
ncbi:MAG: dienelactone hydrolase family protein [Chloroflexi bacterium]|nr:dienelactone hydrolase family protein [Chloroflexota bacterium]